MRDEPIVVFERVHDAAKIPEYQTPQASGMDLAWAEVEFLAHADRLCLKPGDTERLFTGLRLRYLTPGYEIQVRPRSGLAFKHGVTILNGVGTIDADYRGEIGILLVNHGPDDWYTSRGDRVAQMVVCPVARAAVKEVPKGTRGEVFIGGGLVVTDTERGAGGFGSTGL